MVGKNLIVTRLDNQNVDLRKPVSFKEAEKEVFFFGRAISPQIRT